MTQNSKITRIFVASDHNGNAARAYLIDRISDWGYPVADLGPDYNSKVDYVDYASAVCQAVSTAPCDHRGVLLCGTGTGMAIVANRFPLIRAGLATCRATSELMRRHNDANVLVLGQWRTPLGQMDELVRTFLDTPFEGGRHVQRLEKIGRLRP